MQLLVDSGANIYETNFVSLLIITTIIIIVILLLYQSGETALHSAAQNGHVNVGRLLIWGLGLALRPDISIINVQANVSII